ncbi:MAG: N-acetylmuramoyl-L-alanine amidase [Gemmatimonadetes bacterium]|nr:N-acetylmuramoyl-L-alanine amidase [Gemmatimonadota bacterium]NNM07088.1 N-acetylmuramoyl-L-alanine amidase [Gemmatimonadota bacterium]
MKLSPRRMFQFLILRRGLLACGLLLLFPTQLQSHQEAVSVRVEISDGTLDPQLGIVTDRGFPAVPVQDMARLGWTLTESDGRTVASWKGGAPRVVINPDSPFMSWDGQGVHLAEAPYRSSGRLFLPLQVLIDILPWKLPNSFRYDPDTRILTVSDSGLAGGVPLDPVRVVVIDPGHGGRDSGTRGRGGTLEKDVALSIGRALAQKLEADPHLEVYLTRDTDTLIPIWQRGELATAWKGDHPGVFISIHANGVPNSRSVRGYETFFLSEARTEHERRVAALENAAQEFEELGEESLDGSDLSFILSELRNLDHQHWSALLAELVQTQLQNFHPGPNRGVKQGPLAVITNALMPAVLVEVGFLTNPEEEALVSEESFQDSAATALAAAVREFFRRYAAGEEKPLIPSRRP